MNSDIFIITHEVNDSPYLFYLHEGYWNVEKITNSKNASGYIVQEVHITNDSGIDELPVKVDYFEAWRVISGKVEDFEVDNPDDSFKFGMEGMEEYLIKISMGHKGIIKYNTYVYWIEENDELFYLVDSWKPRTIKQAGKLKSATFDDYSDVFNLTIIGERRFEHEVSFDDGNCIKDALIKLYEKRLKGKDEYIRYELEELFEDSMYSYLIDEICSEFAIGENDELL